MLDCTLGRINGAIVRKSFSGFTFVELDVPVDSYNDSPLFNLTIDDLKKEYRVVGSDVYMQEGGKAVMHVSGILSSQSKWMDLKPSSYSASDIHDVLKSMGISNGPHTQVTMVNLFLTASQLAITLANMSPKLAFIDFTDNAVVYYQDLYKKKPLTIKSAFRRTYSRPPMAGFLGFDDSNVGFFPSDAQTVVPFGQFTNVDHPQMENLVKNCNGISELFSGMQVFTAPHTMELGDAVMSNLTYDKKVIVGAEEHYEVNDCVTALYYCI